MSDVTASRMAPLRRWTTPTIRLAVAAALLAAAALVWLERTAYRGWEAWGAGALTEFAGSTQVLVNRDRASWFIGTDTPAVFGLTVTAECTSALITLSLLAVTGVLMAVSRIRVATLMAAVGLAVGTFFALNIVRLTAIALATKTWSDSGFHWSHVWAGTFVTVFGGVAVCGIYLMVLLRRR